AQATLSPILQARPGFLSPRPHPAQGRGKARGSLLRSTSIFWGLEQAGLLSGLWPLISRPPTIHFP
ncbi:hypothetical protein P7K49_023833, partial [Saguinus oedipus]